MKSSLPSYLMASSAKWLADPAAEVPKTYLPGSALMALMNSFRFFAGTLGVVLTISGPTASSDTGVKSATTS